MGVKEILLPIALLAASLFRIKGILLFIFMVMKPLHYGHEVFTRTVKR